MVFCNDGITGTEGLTNYGVAVDYSKCLGLTNVLVLNRLTQGLNSIKIIWKSE
jgi:hypothetical protein